MGNSGALYAQTSINNTFTGNVTVDKLLNTQGLAIGSLSKQVSYTVNNSFAMVLANAINGAITITLSNANVKGSVQIVKKVDSTANVVTVQPGTGTIDGAASVALTAQNESVICVFDGTNWQIAGQVATTIL